MIRFIHGFNVRDGGRKSLGPLADEYAVRLCDEVELFSWGWSGVLSVRLKTKGAIREFVQRQIECPAHTWAGHSHGCHIICAALEALPDDAVRPSRIVLLQPAMSVRYPLPDIPTLVRYNPGDLAVWWGKQWRRFNPVSWVKRHPWGAAGRYGFRNPPERVAQVDTSDDYHCRYAYRGHGVDGGNPGYWAAHDVEWIGGQ